MEQHLASVLTKLNKEVDQLMLDQQQTKQTARVESLRTGRLFQKPHEGRGTGTGFPNNPNLEGAWFQDYGTSGGRTLLKERKTRTFRKKPFQQRQQYANGNTYAATQNQGATEHQNCNQQPANLHKIFQTNTRTRAPNRTYATGPSRKAAITIPYRMVQINGQPLGTENSGKGIQNPIQKEPTINNAPGALQKEGDQRSSNTHNRRSSSIFSKKPAFHNSEEKRWAKTGFGPKRSKQLRTGKALQNGVLKNYMYSNKEEELYDLSGFRRYIYAHSNTQTIKEVPEVPLEWKEL
ncbi:hypothetical protein BB560_001876 [Smittium megazygosporum]|uniref:Uncharacterized protein n=1 Tax=Smittium megazygosporum TaxID=133381 RepID=A0A2T9ZGC9_9FUNG|nr:hypothetical protein BB560_001876 [Smittium megazygosporum]